MRCPVFTTSGVWHIDTWFADSPFGVHVLLKSIEKLCDRAGFKGHYKNHSLRATAATRLHEAGIAEQLIYEKSSPQFDRTNAQTMNNREWVKYFIHVNGKGENSSDGKGWNSSDGQCEKRMKSAITVILIAVYLVNLI